MKNRLLLIAKEPDLSFLLDVIRKANRFEAITAASGTEGIEILNKQNAGFDLVLCSDNSGDTTGIETIAYGKKLNPKLQFIFITEHAEVKSAVQAMKAGAFDCLPMPTNPEEVLATINQALQQTERINKNSGLLKKQKEQEERFASEYQNLTNTSKENFNTGIEGKYHGWLLGEIDFYRAGLNENQKLLLEIINSQTFSLYAFKAIRDENNYIIDLEYRFANKVSEHIAGIINLKGKRFSEVFRNVDHVSLLDAYRRVIETVEPDERIIPFNDNTHKGWYRSIATKLGDGILISAEDITAQKNAELKIKEQAHYIESIINTLPDSIFIFDPCELRNIFVNKEVYYLLGYTPEEILAFGVGLQQPFIHPDDWPEQAKLLQDLLKLKDGKVQDAEYRLIHKDGFPVWVHSRRTVFERDVNGKVIKVLAIMHDITPLKESEAKVRSQAHFIQQVTETVPDMITVMKLPSREIEFSNTEPFRMYGFDADEIKSMSNEQQKQLIHPDDQLALQQYFKDFNKMNDKDKNVVEYRAKNKEGNWVWFRVRGRVSGEMKQVYQHIA